jgi:uncharacterized protein
VQRLQLTGQSRPFTRCLCCNVPVQPVDKAEVLQALPAQVAAAHRTFMHCPVCERVYWPGGHHRRMLAMLRATVGELPGLA